MIILSRVGRANAIINEEENDDVAQVHAVSRPVISLLSNKLLGILKIVAYLHLSNQQQH